MTGTPTADSAAGPVANTKGASADSGVRPAGVSAAAAQEHRQLAALLAAAGSGVPSAGDPRRPVALLQIAMAALCSHLSAIETEVLPVARRHLPAGRREVEAQLHQAHRMHLHLRTLEQRTAGEIRHVRLPLPALREELEALLDAHIRVEQEFFDRLEAVLSEPDRRQLRGRFLAALDRGPTRAHPYAPHTGLLARPASRLNAAWDRTLDAMDSRHVPRRVPRPQVAEPGRRGAWMLGRPSPSRSAYAGWASS
jgi:hypothetical protein